MYGIPNQEAMHVAKKIAGLSFNSLPLNSFTVIKDISFLVRVKKRYVNYYYLRRKFIYVIPPPVEHCEHALLCTCMCVVCDMIIVRFGRYFNIVRKLVTVLYDKNYIA